MPDLDFTRDDEITASNIIESFAVLSKATVIGNNKSMLSILNASGSIKIVRIREVRIINTQNTSITGVVSDFSFYRFTGHSAGTDITPFAFDTADSLNSSITAKTNATIAGEGQELFHIEWSSDEWGVGTQDVESNDHAMQLIHPVYTHTFTTPLKPYTLRAGEGFHIKHTTNSTAGSFDVYIAFTQEIF